MTSIGSSPLRSRSWRLWRGLKLRKKTRPLEKRPTYVPLPPFTDSRQIDPPHELCVAAIMRNEGPYLEEWIDFHRLCGVERFILYDNDSTDDTVGILQPYVDKGVVTLIPWPHYNAKAKRTNLQNKAYAHALSFMRGQTRWLALIDLDEFLFSPTGSDLTAVLRDYQDLPAVVAFWATFGGSGHLKPPAGGLVDSYTQRLPLGEFKLDTLWTYYFKSIVQPHRTRGVLNPHVCVTDEDHIRGWTEAREPVDETFTLKRHKLASLLSCERLRINHYYTKSWEEYRQRRATDPHSWVTNLTYRNPELVSVVERWDSLNQGAVHDDTLIRVREGLRSRCGMGEPQGTLRAG